MKKDMKVWAIKLRGRSFYKDSYDIPFVYPTRRMRWRRPRRLQTGKTETR